MKTGAKNLKVQPEGFRNRHEKIILTPNNLWDAIKLVIHIQIRK